VFDGLAFFIMLPLMKRTLTISLDFDWFYRYLAPILAKIVVNYLLNAQQLVNKFLISLKSSLSFDDKLDYQLSIGKSVGLIIFFFSILLLCFVVL
jgi:multicomponent Na+:H+ antiporter subunit D